MINGTGVSRTLFTLPIIMVNSSQLEVFDIDGGNPPACSFFIKVISHLYADVGYLLRELKVVIFYVKSFMSFVTFYTNMCCR